MGLAVPIIQIVGYQNSGKTTIVEKIVKQGSNRGLRIGTIKHHGHGGEPTPSDIGKDTLRHREAGACLTTVEGGGLLQLHASNETWSLDEIVRLYTQFVIDFILVEGFKHACYPKVVIIRTEADLQLLTDLTEIKAVITWIPLNEEIQMSFKTFSVNEDENYTNWVLQYCEG